MLSQLRSSASAMLANQLYMSVIANNLANVNTVGFKESGVQFHDLVYGRLSPTGEFVAGFDPDRWTAWLGTGVRPVATPRVHTTGALLPSDDPLHMAIGGEGFFVVELPDGNAAYTRDGTFSVDSEGRLVSSEGFPVLPGVTVPEGASDVTVHPDGLVFADVPGEGRRQIGEIQLVRFTNPQGLIAVGRNLYLATGASGDPEAGLPNTQGFGPVIGGVVESSNVNVAEQLTNMLMAQRAYSLNARVLQSIDEMLGLANNLRR